METITKNIPALALRGLTVFPRMTASFDVEREISVRALERAMETGQEIFLVTQRELGVELPEEKDLYEVGTVARVMQILRASNSMMRVVMEGGSRARLRRLWQREPFLQAQVELIGEEKSPRHGTRTEAMLRQTYALFGEYSELLPKQPESIFTTVMDATDPGFLADFIAQNSNLRYQDKQSVLEELRPLMRLRRVNEILKREISVIAMEQDIESKVRERVGQIQKDMILREQVKVLQNELGEGDSDAEFDEYRTRICACRLPEETEKKLLKDVDRLSRQPFGSAEASVLRNPGVHRRAQAQSRRQRADHLPCRPAGRGQDVHRAEHRQGDEPQGRAAVARRRAGRGGHPRSPQDLHRRDARPHHRGHLPQRLDESAARARRGG